ncbi:hypothetical protein Poli38472_006072 [Pythium oligandrum]|uniref:Hexose transporter 1 n=1 Tax=Pythium oligandrum TaxID=41045 RepID=A0A8K1CS79_PYTOL|nr:hypothetical protein Poli38472_006072 [Pythium oligandrum]|eukprot:TMW68604.1 hypothetical protein Poli38472_006072 [Pythium oligandrum]
MQRETKTSAAEGGGKAYEPLDARTPKDLLRLRDTTLQGDSLEGEDNDDAFVISVGRASMHRRLRGLSDDALEMGDTDDSLSASTVSTSRVEQQRLRTEFDVEEEDEPDGCMPWMQVAVLALSAISGFLFGYDLCVMVVALPLIHEAMDLSTTAAQSVVSVLMVGAFFGSLAGGVLADRIGRKPAIIWTGMFFLAGSFCMTFAPSFSVLLGGRFLAGLAVGSSAPCVSAYVAEIARPEHRGALVTINEVMVCIGCLVSVCVSVSLKESSNGWRKMLGLTLLPPIVQLIGMPLMPESPRWLIAQKDRAQDAKAVLQRLFPHNDADTEIKMQMANQVLNKGFWDVVHEIRSDRTTRRRVVLSILIALAHTLTGANAMLYYSSYILDSLNPSVAFTANLSKEYGVAVAKVAGVCTAVAVVDRIGRRPLILFGSLVMVLCQFVFAACFWRLETAPMGNFEALGIWNLYVYIYAWNLSWAPLMWVICSEILPDDVRSIGMGLTFAVYWLGSSLVNQTLLSMFDSLGMTGTFSIYAALTSLALVFLFWKVPETRGLSFEQITKLFQAK